MADDDSVQHFHMAVLRLANEQNPNNARVPRQAGKGYSECLARGWIAECQHPHGGYAYFALTAAGEAAMRRPKEPRKRTAARLGQMPERLGPARSLLGPPPDRRRR